MSVPVGRRNLSRFEVLYNATKLNDEITSLALRSFGVYSRNSPMRKKYQNLVRHSKNEAYVDSIIERYKEDLLTSAQNVEINLRLAKSTYPTDLDSFSKRQDYKYLALDECKNIKFILHLIACQFRVDLNVFKNPYETLSTEMKLIKGWIRSDNRRYNKKFNIS